MQIRPSGTVYSLLAGLIIGIHASLLMWSGYVHSPTHAEVFHLAAGASHIELGRFDLLRVNPPLVRLVAAFPVMLSHPFTDWRSYDPDPLRRAEYDAGLAFFTANEASTVWLTTLSRWACIPFSVLGAWVCYSWAGRLYGVAPSFIALILWTTSPFCVRPWSVDYSRRPRRSTGRDGRFLFLALASQANAGRDTRRRHCGGSLS